MLFQKIILFDRDIVNNCKGHRNGNIAFVSKSISEVHTAREKRFGIHALSFQKRKFYKCKTTIGRKKRNLYVGKDTWGR